MKVCRDCGVNKPLDNYHKHNRMKDGHLNKCKVCVIARVGRHRSKNIESIRAYDRRRGNRQGVGYTKAIREKQPNRYKAQTMVGNAIRDLKLFRESCEVCGADKVHGHHDDYLKPLNVRWLCPAHHSQWHAENGPGFNP